MHDVWYGSSTVDSDYCRNYFGSAGTAAEKILCIIIIVLLSVFGLALAVYMGLTMLFVDAVRSQPPV